MHNCTHNYASADALEKVVCLAVVMKERSPDASVTIDVEDGKAEVTGAGAVFFFGTTKGLMMSMEP